MAIMPSLDSSSAQSSRYINLVSESCAALTMLLASSTVNLSPRSLNMLCHIPGVVVAILVVSNEKKKKKKKKNRSYPAWFNFAN